MPIPYCLEYYCFVVFLKSGSESPPILFFFFRVVLAVFDLLQLDMNFRISLSVCTKDSSGILVETALNL